MERKNNKKASAKAKAAAQKKQVEDAKLGGSAVAVASHQMTGAGKHGGSPRAQNRRTRQGVAQKLRSGRYDDC